MLQTKSEINQYYEFCLRGDLRGALKSLSLISRGNPTKVRRFKKKVERRFIQRIEPLHPRCSDPLVRTVISEYRRYYRESLLSPKKAKRMEEHLLRILSQQLQNLGRFKNPKVNWDLVERELALEFSRRGFYSLFGRVSPLRSLLVWKKQKIRHFSVPLLSGPQKVKVVLLDEFTELGWLHFATFGRYYVGGWAKKDRLFCVLQAYKYNLKGEAFRVSYLNHEAQHFSDYKKFPKLAQADLEYRAKLAELITAKNIRRLIEKFRSEAKRDPKFPHCYASWRLLKDLGTIQNASTIRKSASTLLRQDTKKHKNLKRSDD